MNEKERTWAQIVTMLGLCAVAGYMTVNGSDAILLWVGAGIIFISLGD